MKIEGPLQEQPHRYDTGRYDFDLSMTQSWSRDPVMTLSEDERVMWFDWLRRSPDWRQRVRAQVLLETFKVTLPDDFPCIVEDEDSQNLTAHGRQAPPVLNRVWVKHPKIEVLEAVLPEYQALWDEYLTSRGARWMRTFTIDRVSGLSPRGLWREDAGPDEILLAARATHGMPSRGLPERLREPRESA